MVYPILLDAGKLDNPDSLSPDALAKVAFEEMDYTKSNTITKDEFIKACLGNDNLATSLAYKMLDMCVMDCQ